ncbi:MAG: GNAT family N-acetyltransferase, partial [Reinekea sp.]|nr:GNAT family N-acetyltransferase [Reinekea sp.]
ALKGYGLWLVEDRYSHEFIGRVGLLYPEGWPALEVGWGIHPNHWGKGYATEAGSAAADWALESLGCESLISIIDPNNNASKAVAMRLGEQYDHNEFVKGRDCEIFKMTKTDFYQRKA